MTKADEQLNAYAKNVGELKPMARKKPIPFPATENGPFIVADYSKLTQGVLASAGSAGDSATRGDMMFEQLRGDSATPVDLDLCRSNLRRVLADIGLDHSIELVELEASNHTVVLYCGRPILVVSLSQLVVYDDLQEAHRLVSALVSEALKR